MSLIFPAYLLGLLGLALPWILHRFSDQQPPVQLFPSRQFLEPTTPPVSRKRTLRYRALLALRVLAIILLCLLFAQPWIKSDNLPLSRQLHHMIVVDQSLSMRADGRWAAAQDIANRLIDDVGDASAQLIGFDRRVNVLATNVENQQGSPISLSAALDNLQPGYAPADYGLLMQRLDRLAADEELPVKVWLVSDMQRSSLPAQLNALYAPHVAELEFVPVEIGELVNVHLVAEAESANGATANVSVSLLASVAGGEEPTNPILKTVRVEVSGNVLEERSASLSPGELHVMNFEGLVLPAVSDPRFLVSLLEPDALAEDNSQLIPVNQAQSTGVVLLSAPDESVSTSSAVFLSTALETDALSVVERIRGTAQQVPTDSPHLFTGRNLQDPLGADILQFVDTGSNALVYNNVVTETGEVASLEGISIGAIDEVHPLGLGDISWSGTKFYDLPAFTQRENDRVLLQTLDGHSVLVERPTNRGRLLILNDPLDGLASNLPLQPAFVSLMQSLISYFDASTSVPTQVVIGNRLAIPPNVQLIDSSGDAMVALSAASQASTLELENPGLYTVVSARGEQTLRAVLDPEEANLSRLSSSALDAWQARYAVDSSADDNSATSDAALTDTAKFAENTDFMQQSLWQWLLPLSALLLFAEGWFANRRIDIRRDGS